MRGEWAWWSLVLVACTGDADGPKRLPDDDRDGYQTDVDCDDADPAVNPGVTADGCDGVDEDCDGEVDEDPDLAWYPDLDRDGFGDAGAEPVRSCGEPPDTVASRTDCDDDDADVFPGNDEACDGRDNDCDGGIDEGVAGVGIFYADADGDGAGDPGAPRSGCAGMEGVVDNALDCDDTDDTDPIFVSTTGSGTAAGRLASPLSRIQDGMNRSHGCVVVLPGTYAENLVWPGGDLYVRSRDGSASTRVEGTGNGPSLSVYSGEGAGAVFEGFTLIGGTGRSVVTGGYSSKDYDLWYYEYIYWFGGGVFVYGSSPTLRDLVIAEAWLPGYSYTEDGTTGVATTTDSLGGGVYVEAGAPTFEDVSIQDTHAGTGGAIFVSSGSDVRMRRLEVYGTAAQYGNVTVSAGSLDVENLVMNGVTADTGWGGFLVSQGTLAVRNATVTGAGVAFANWGGSYLSVRDSIVVGNDYYGLLTYEDYGSSFLDLAYNDFYANDGGNYSGIADPTGTNGNLSASPKFVAWSPDDGDPTNDDLHLSRSSPCVDAGDPSRQDVDGTVVDMGAWGGPAGSW